jgi:dTDP-4-dehydrorhamnose reductase
VVALNGRAAIIGANGQLGTEVVRAFAEDGRWEPVPLLHQDVEIGNPESVKAMVAAHKPAVIVNTAAYHVVAETANELEFFRVNALGAKYLAEAARTGNIMLVHVSTDYVFDGELGRPYREEDVPRPLGVYGASKLAGEHLIRAVHDRHFIIRVSGVYGKVGCRAKGGRNFVRTILEQAGSGKPIRVVTDQVVTTTYAVDAARALPNLIARAPHGTYHLANPGPCTWYEFAAEILELAGLRERVELEPVSSADFYSSVKRPSYSALDNAALRRAGLPDLRHRREAVAAYLKERTWPDA